jgi:hypothetical protein
LLAGGSLVVGALMAALQEPKHRAYAAALTGLSREQRSGALRSLSGGDIPTDPAVLLAAMEIAAVAAAGRNPGRGLWVLRMVILALWAVSVIYLIGNGNVAQGVVWAGLGSVLAGDWAWD